MSDDFLQVMTERGYLHQCTDAGAVRAAMKAGSVTAYVGYDCTAPSLHVGHLVSIMMLRRLERLGGKPIVVMGGGTTKIGDPSGRDESRKILSTEQIDQNLASIRAVFTRLLPKFEMVNNAEWLDRLNFIEFLRDYGKHFSVNRMLTMDSVKLRLEREQPLSYLEFSYMLFQAYDFLELYRRHKCTLQMGGSDQWGNIVNGIELTRKVENAEVFGLTTPLITTAGGAKMGKTADGAVWLNADQYTPYQYWQYWRNTEDADVERFLKLFTELPLEEIGKLSALQGAERNEAKRVLATEATALLHGREAADAAAGLAKKTFEQGGTSETVIVPELSKGLPLYELLVRAGLAKSNSEARKLVQGNGVRVNDTVATDERQVMQGAAFKLSVGKKRHVQVRSS